VAYRFRTPGPWGPGEAEDLPPDAIDGNFWQAIQDIAAKAVAGVGIANFVVSGNQFTVVLTDHTLLGPYTLPVVLPKFKGEWLPDYNYLAGDIISHAGITYGINVNHLSEATFDPGANTDGNDWYTVLLENPALIIPAGGAAGAFLRKITLADYDFTWTTAALADLTDVSLPISPGPASGDVLTFSGGLWTAAPLSAMELLLSQLGDVDVLESPSPTTGQLLTWNGTAWTNDDPAFQPTITAPTAGQLLTYEAGAWKNTNTANIPVLAGVNVFGSLTLDYSQGSVQRVTMTNGVTLSGITNWPAAGQFGRLVLEVRNTGAYTWTWPTTYKWPGGADPVVSVSGRDIFALTTFDGGSTVDGSVIGQNYL